MPTPAMIESLTAQGKRRSIEAGTVLCRQGQPSTEAFVVINGTIEATIELEGNDHVVASHGAGALVGEVTTVVGGFRTATLRVNEASTVSVVAKDVLSRWLDENPEAAAAVLAMARERTDRTRVAAMMAERLGPGSEAMATAIAQRMTWTAIEAGEEIFREGDPADCAYLLVSGQLRAGTDAKTARNYTRGDVIGASGLFDGGARTYTVVARRRGTLGRLSAAEYVDIAAEHPRAATLLAWRLNQANAPIERKLARSVAIVATTVVKENVSAAAMLATIVEAVEARAKTAALNPAVVDALLSSPGLAEVERGGIGEARLAELLHQMEVDHDVVLLDGAAAGAEWVGRILRHADQVVVLCSDRPDDEEATEIKSVTDEVDHLVPVWLGIVHRSAATPSTTSRLLDRFDIDEAHHLRPGLAADVERLGRLAAGRGIALVLSGGGGRGFAHLGVVRSLDELGLPFDRIAGASMGAAIAGAVATGLEGAELADTIEEQFKGLLDYTVPLVSLLKGERIAANITEHFAGRNIEDLWIPFSCVSTNLTRSRTETHRRGPVDQAVRASVAIPGILPPVPYRGDLLVDGGVLDNLPLDLVVDDPSIATVIAVDVSPPKGPRAKTDFGLSVSGWAAITDRVMPGRRQLPSLASVLMRSVSVGAARARDGQVNAGVADLYLDLDLAGVGLLEFENVGPIAERGYRAAHPRVLAWLEERS